MEKSAMCRLTYKIEDDIVYFRIIFKRKKNLQ